MARHPLAGLPAPDELLINVARLLSRYYELHPDPTRTEQRVAFGTSGHRGTSTDGSFNEDHILAICQAIAEHRREQGISGPLFVGIDTHALSEAAFGTALEVFAAHGIKVVIDEKLGYTPTPVISREILTHNNGGRTVLADGVVITPSHNPPEDGGFKYNPPSGGPADTDITAAIQNRANTLLETGLHGVRRARLADALEAPTTRRHDFITGYVEALGSALNLDAVAAAGIRIGVDPLGGASLPFWEPIAERYGLDIQITNRSVDPRFSFMHVDRDGKIRMDCSSPDAMAGLVTLKGDFDIAFGTDPDADRHGIVTPFGLMNPNHFLAVAIQYLFTHRPGWAPDCAIGKTVVTSSMVDRVAAGLGRRLVEVPVGFKWFVSGLLEGSLGFGGEESAGASFLRRDGSVWTTDKDGLLMALLAAEITAVTGKHPGEHYRELEERFGSPLYERIDAPATLEQKASLARLSPEMVTARELAGEPILARLTRAQGNDAPIGGLKVVTENGWFAARPSGTEDIYKIYAESFRDEDHLRRIQQEAREIVAAALVR